jgi:methionyl aminopeptidase
MIKSASSLCSLLLGVLLVQSALVAVCNAWTAPAPLQAASATRLYMQDKAKKASKGFAGPASKASYLSNKFSRFNFAGPLRPFPQSPQRKVSSQAIVVPDYASTGRPMKPTQRLLPWIVEVKTPEQIQSMRRSGLLAREILDLAGRAVLPGVTTDEIDTLVHNAIVEVSE